MSRTRVLIGEGPPILQAIVRDIVATAADMKLVGKGPAWSGQYRRAGRDWLRGSVDRLRPDVVVVCHDGEDPGHMWGDLLASHPDLRILAITPDGRELAVYELLPRRILIGEGSGPDLLRAIRRGAELGTPATQAGRDRPVTEDGMGGSSRMMRSGDMMRNRQGADLAEFQRMTTYRTGPSATTFARSEWPGTSQGYPTGAAYPPVQPPQRWPRPGAGGPRPPTSTIGEALAGLVTVIGAQIQKSGIGVETAALVEEFAKQASKTRTANFQEWRRDLNRTIQGIVSAAGGTVDPAAGPKKYQMKKVRRLLSDEWSKFVQGLQWS